VTVTVTDAPRAHPKTVDQFRLAVWAQWPGGAIEPIANAGRDELHGTWPVMLGGVVTTVLTAPPGDDPSAALTLRLGFVDPVRRMSELLTINAP
jgi:hypothetical protein